MPSMGGHFGAVPPGVKWLSPKTVISKKSNNFDQKLHVVSIVFNLETLAPYGTDGQLLLAANFNVA